MVKKKHTLSGIIFFILLMSSIQLEAQSLNPGDIAFIGYNTDSGPSSGQDHSFTFITLNDIPDGEVIYFTEEGWDDVNNTWAGTTEGHLQWTSPSSGISCGTIIFVTESGSDTFTVIGGGTISLQSGTGWNLSAGDQVLAYQATTIEPSSLPNFIAGINGDDGSGSPNSFNSTTMWNDPATGPLGTAKSGLPFGLTNGVNCISLFTSFLTEQDNAKYTGILTGDISVLRASINDRTNWSFDNTTAFDITLSSYTSNVDCSSLSNSSFSLNSSFYIYPNPAKEYISILGLNEEIEYSIFNLLGVEIKKGTLLDRNKIFIQDLKSGVYLLKMGEGVYSKFIKK